MSYKKDWYILSRIANDLAEKLINKLANEKNFMPFDYLKPPKPYWQEWSPKKHFIIDFIDKIADIFISYKEFVDYEFVFKL